MNEMRKKTLRVSLFLSTIIFLSVSLFKPLPCAAAVVWEDNFEDGDFDNNPTWIVQNGTFSATDETLKATEDYVWNVVNTTSTVAYGTWSCDIEINTTDIRGMDHMYVIFMMNDYNHYYDIMIWVDPTSGPGTGFTLLKRVGEEDIELGSRDYDDGLSGVYHLMVTRATDGHFYVYVDGVAIIDAVDTTYTTSKYFGFVTMSRHALDNITVDNEITVFPDPVDLKFKDESVSVSCKKNDSTTASIYVQNLGDIAGSATLAVGTTPDGITVTLDSTSITDLKLDTSQTVIATIEASSAITPGDYEVNVELRDGSTVLDTIKLEITISEASKPPPDEDSPGFLVIGVIFAIGTILMYRRKEKM
ncbi:MAG: hypothetical protein ACFFDT_06455 [Candidatus Hodarchaeota archaeon]